MDVVSEKGSTIESLLDLYASAVTDINDFQRRQQAGIDCFQAKMKQFVDEVTKNASEKLRINCDYRRGKLLKQQEELQVVQKKMLHVETYLSDIAEQNFTVGISKNKSYLVEGVDDHLKKTPLTLTPPDPKMREISIPEYFDGKLIVENFFTFLRTHGENDELIKIFRRYVHERFSRASGIRSPAKPPELKRASQPAQIESPDKQSLPETATKAPIPILVHDSSHSIADPRLHSRQLQRSPAVPKDSHQSPHKLEKIHRVYPMGIANNVMTCCICLAHTNPIIGQVCSQCSCFYHLTCHTPVIEKACMTWVCIKCTEKRFSTATKISNGQLNIIQKVVSRNHVFRMKVEEYFSGLCSNSCFDHSKDQ